MGGDKKQRQRQRDGDLRFLLVIEVVNELVSLVNDGHQLLEEQLLTQLLRLRLLPICNQTSKSKHQSNHTKPFHNQSGIHTWVAEQGRRPLGGLISGAHN